MPHTPALLPEFEPDQNFEDLGNLTGSQFVYTTQALGLSPEAQDKLIELVDGRGLQAAGSGNRLKWQDMSSALADIHASRKYDQRFGTNVAEELRRLELGVQATNK